MALPFGAALVPTGRPVRMVAVLAPLGLEVSNLRLQGCDVGRQRRDLLLRRRQRGPQGLVFWLETLLLGCESVHQIHLYHRFQACIVTIEHLSPSVRVIGAEPCSKAACTVPREKPPVVMMVPRTALKRCNEPRRASRV